MKNKNIYYAIASRPANTVCHYTSAIFFGYDGEKPFNVVEQLVGDTQATLIEHNSSESEILDHLESWRGLHYQSYEEPTFLKNAREVQS